MKVRVVLEAVDNRFEGEGLTLEEITELYARAYREGSFPLDDQFNDGFRITVQPIEPKAGRRRLSRGPIDYAEVERRRQETDRLARKAAIDAIRRGSSRQRLGSR